MDEIEWPRLEDDALKSVARPDSDANQVAGILRRLAPRGWIVLVNANGEAIGIEEMKP